MKKKGFTLIELLAVILILGIIALIAIPTVSKIVAQAKKGSFETTVSNLVQAVADANSLQQLTNDTLVKTYSITDGAISPSLNLKGKLPESGSIVVNDKGEISLAVYDGKYCATKTYTDSEVSVSETTKANCNIPMTVVSIHMHTSGLNTSCDPNGSIYPCLGEVVILPFSYDPEGYLKASGQVLSIAAYSSLYTVYGTNFGGNGTTTFSVPNLASSSPLTGVNYFVTLTGSTPSYNSITPTVSNGFNYFTYQTTTNSFMLGEIRLASNVDETKYNMLPCDGRLLQISQYSSLFSTIGTYYGGNGVTTFALPNLSNVTSPVAGMKYYIVVNSSLYPTRP